MLNVAIESYASVRPDLRNSFSDALSSQVAGFRVNRQQKKLGQVIAEVGIGTLSLPLAH